MEELKIKNIEHYRGNMDFSKAMQTILKNGKRKKKKKESEKPPDKAG